MQTSWRSYHVGGQVMCVCAWAYCRIKASEDVWPIFPLLEQSSAFYMGPATYATSRGRKSAIATLLSATASPSSLPTSPLLTPDPRRWLTPKLPLYLESQFWFRPT